MQDRYLRDLLGPAVAAVDPRRKEHGSHSQEGGQERNGEQPELPVTKRCWKCPGAHDSECKPRHPVAGLRCRNGAARIKSRAV